jgi:3-deoxy-7-phosphoheptulonate synthase
MMQTSDLRIAGIEALTTPNQLKQEIPATEQSVRTVLESREVIQSIITGEDDRMLAIIGPCSIHDPKAAMEYAHRLGSLHVELSDRIYIAMRVYFEKPRTALGWRGLILDPRLDGSNDIQTGLRLARRLLVQITELGLPTASEMLDPIVPQYTSDLTSWAAIGARTTESQTHREMASGLSMPVGFKNSTDGSLDAAVNALKSSRHPHSFIGIDPDGRICVLTTTGNKYGHVILRGGRQGPNYATEWVEAARKLLTEAGYPPAVMVDCSHANSLKDATRQQKVLKSVIGQRIAGQGGIIGFMLESNLFEGQQEISDDIAGLAYGVSVTDACIGWDETEQTLRWVYNQLAR